MATSALDDEVSLRLDLAVRVARAAGQLTGQYFQHGALAVERKADNSPVTIADREAEQLLRREIASAFPDDSILGEEFGVVDGTSGYRWILDPIDGTKSFIAGVPLYSTLVGVQYRQQCRLGVIYLPALDEIVYGALGGGAYYCHANEPPRRARVSTRSHLADAIFVTSQVNSFAVRGAAEAFTRLERSCYITRTWGDAYGYFLVATGRADIMIDPIMNLWDAAAILPVLIEAGGSFTDWQGQTTVDHGEGVATNGRLLADVLAITRDFPRPA